MPRSPRRRVALYSHDTQGLGHVRRNIEIAAALVAARPGTDVLLLTGTPAAAALPLPPGAEVVVLPGVAKNGPGAYAAASLGLRLGEVLDLRGRMIESALAAFSPDLVVVDKVARGLGGELDAALRTLRSTIGPRGLPTRVVLGLRDVLDDPATARAEWEAEDTTAAVRASYDAVWVYGDPRVHDLAATLRLPGDVAAMVRHTGYLAHGRGGHVTTPPAGDPTPPEQPYVLCLVGGGQDGHLLADTVARTPLPAGHRAVLVTGPCMPVDQRQRLQDLAAHRPDLDVHSFVGDTRPLVAGAAAVVSMGGYNSVCELLTAGRPTLVVPRTSPRREQLVRAEGLAPHTGLDHVRAEHATPALLAGWLDRAVRRAATPHDLDLDGLGRLPRLVDDLLAPTLAEETSRATA